MGMGRVSPSGDQGNGELGTGHDSHRCDDRSVPSAMAGDAVHPTTHPGVWCPMGVWAWHIPG